jgi:TolB protein
MMRVRLACAMASTALACASAPVIEAPAPEPVAAPATSLVIPAPGEPPLVEPVPSLAREAPGEILYAFHRDGHIGVRAIRPSDGATRVVADDPELSLYPAGGTPSLLVVARGGEADHAEQLALVGPGGALQTIGPRATRVRNPTLAPGGRFVVVESDHEGFRELYRVELESGVTTRLTRHASGHFEPSISPDGRRLALVSSRDGDAEVYASDARGRGLARLTHFHRDDWAPAWSPAGDAIAFLSDREGTDRIFLMQPDGTELRRLTGETAAVAEGPFVWSPDGSRIAYVARSADATAELRVVVLASGASSTVARALTIEFPTWSPDGRYLAFGDGSAELAIATPDGSATIYLATGPGDAFLPRWF